MTATAETVRLSIAQVGALAYRAGFRGMQLIYATAIAMRESGGRPDAECDHCIPKPGGGFYNDDSHGLWQINVAPGAHPQYDKNRLETDLAYQATAAWEVSGHGTTFRPWQTPSGNFLTATDVPKVTRELAPLLGPDAKAKADALLAGLPATLAGSGPVNGSASAVPNVIQPAGGITDLFNPFDPNKWFGVLPRLFGVTDFKDMAERGALILFGALLIVVGFLMLVRDQGAGQVVADTTKKAAGAAKQAAKVAATL